MIQSFRIGVARVYLPTSTTSALGSFSTLAPTASATNLLDSAVNDVQSTLDTTAAYSFIIAPIGEDKVYGGYTLGPGSQVFGPVTVSANQGILINIPSSSFPSNLSMAGGIAVYMKKNSGNYQPLGPTVMDPNGNDYNFIVVNEPLSGAAAVTAAQLQSSVADPTFFGSRAPYGYLWLALSPTEGGVTVSYDTNEIPIKPDTGTNFNAVAGRGTTISFKLLANDLKNVIQSTAGNYAQVTDRLGHTISTATMSLQTAVAIIQGNKPFKMQLPPDANKISELDVFFASINQNQTPTTLSWTKTATAPVSFVVPTVNADTLLQDCTAIACYKWKS
jgi:hypothetical protein